MPGSSFLSRAHLPKRGATFSLAIENRYQRNSRRKNKLHIKWGACLFRNWQIGERLINYRYKRGEKGEIAKKEVNYLLIYQLEIKIATKEARNQRFN